MIRMNETRKSDSGPPVSPIAVLAGPAVTSELPAEPGAISRRLRDIVTLSRDFERHVGQALMVNSTDLAAMEHLITEGSLTPSELSRRLQISTAATTLVVDRLVALGHVSRHPHPHDRRKVVVVPEPRSVTQAFDELMPVLEAFLERVATIYADALRPIRGN